jgi:hypothetical protein
MNQIEWLEQHLRKAEKRLVDARLSLKKNPRSYSAKVTIQSAERHLTDLRKDLQIERKKSVSHQHINLSARA